MKLRVADRILVALAGLLLLACCAGIVAQMFFGVDLVAFAGKVFSSESLKIRAALLAISVFLFILGLYCLFVLFRHRRRKDKFILQKNEDGELAISLKALENMVNKCLAQHREIHVESLQMENQKDGLLIHLRGNVAGGISIPLTVEALQRQIKQYVTACSGVEVKGIRVQIEASGKDAENATFVIDGPAPKPLLKENNEQKPESDPAPNTSEPIAVEASETPIPVSVEATETPAPVHVETPAVPEPVTVDTKLSAAEAAAAQAAFMDGEDDRPLHQRLFGPKSEPCIMPEPPEGAFADDAVPVESAAPEAPESLTEEPAEVPETGDAEAESTEEPVSAEAPEDETGETEAAEAPETAEEDDTEEKRAAREAFTASQDLFDQLITGHPEQEDQSHEA